MKPDKEEIHKEKEKPNLLEQIELDPKKENSDERQHFPFLSEIQQIPFLTANSQNRESFKPSTFDVGRDLRAVLSSLHDV